MLVQWRLTAVLGCSQCWYGTVCCCIYYGKITVKEHQNGHKSSKEPYLIKII